MASAMPMRNSISVKKFATTAVLTVRGAGGASARVSGTSAAYLTGTNAAAARTISAAPRARWPGAIASRRMSHTNTGATGRQVYQSSARPMMSDRHSIGWPRCSRYSAVCSIDNAASADQPPMAIAQSRREYEPAARRIDNEGGGGGGG